MPPLVIPIFISHQGCPHRCIFCDQHAITGKTEADQPPVGPPEVEKIIRQWLARPRRHKNTQVQVAFYGGSFTGLPKELQKNLFEAVRPFLVCGEVQTIRLSTRPDYVNQDTPGFLQDHGVGIVELGVQSMIDAVLKSSGRGHSSEQSVRAIHLLKKSSLSLGVQLMIGLPGDTTCGLLESVRRIAELEPDFARLYPTLVIRESVLADLYNKGEYRPLSLNRAVALTVRAREILAQRGIKIVRMGLQPSVELEKKTLAGPYHPAFGEQVISRQLFKKTRKILALTPEDFHQELFIASADESAFRGPGNINIKRLAALGLEKKMALKRDPAQQRQTIVNTRIPC